MKTIQKHYNSQIVAHYNIPTQLNEFKYVTYYSLQTEFCKSLKITDIVVYKKRFIINFKIMK